MNTEWIVLADYVEYTSGKLYMMGGGWDQVVINHPARLLNCGIAVAFRIEWDEIDLAHDVSISVCAETSQEPIAELRARIELGHQPPFVENQSQLAQLALNLTIEFQDEGVHLLRAFINGTEDRAFPFVVRFGHNLQLAS